ncbi:MAG: PDDEXK nuclease domain-containing protein [Melioribacteraceae bacterium]|nr:PDDEXK nuclease domain-containing protein [Melioribacteraceae bacterium]
MTKKNTVLQTNYSTLIGDVSQLLETARKESARKVNSLLTATYWIIGYRIVEFEIQHREREDYYGEKLLKQVSLKLTTKFGKGFSRQNLQQMVNFYNIYPLKKICQTLSGISFSEENIQTVSGKSNKNKMISTKISLGTKQKVPHTPSVKSLLTEIANNLQLPWSAYVKLLSIKDNKAREFYETETLRNGWSVRQLDRQISSQFYERTLLSKNKSRMLKQGETQKPEDIVTAEEEIKDPFILEFLGLKDEYSENELEEALILHLEKFLLELGSNFAFLGRQKRLRIGNEWFRIDLLFFHRKLRCLVVIDLKVGKFTHADAGQMHMYLNYAKEHWINENENPPIGLILCTEKDKAVAKYSLDGLPNKVLATEFKLHLPDEKLLADELMKTQRIIAKRNLS